MRGQATTGMDLEEPPCSPAAGGDKAKSSVATSGQRTDERRANAADSSTAFHEEDGGDDHGQPRQGARIHKGQKAKPPRDNEPKNCPRCGSSNTKFCYYNNYKVNQPRYYCRACQRFWTAGGILRNVPPGAGRRKNRNGKAMKEAGPAPASSGAKSEAHGGVSPLGMGVAPVYGLFDGASGKVPELPAAGMFAAAANGLCGLMPGQGSYPSMGLMDPLAVNALPNLAPAGLTASPAQMAWYPPFVNPATKQTASEKGWSDAPEDGSSGSRRQRLRTAKSEEDVRPDCRLNLHNGTGSDDLGGNAGTREVSSDDSPSTDNANGSNQQQASNGQGSGDNTNGNGGADASSGGTNGHSQLTTHNSNGLAAKNNSGSNQNDSGGSDGGAAAELGGSGSGSGSGGGAAGLGNGSGSGSGSGSGGGSISGSGNATADDHKGAAGGEQGSLGALQDSYNGGGTAGGGGSSSTFMAMPSGFQPWSIMGAAGNASAGGASMESGRDTGGQPGFDWRGFPGLPMAGPYGQMPAVDPRTGGGAVDMQAFQQAQAAAAALQAQAHAIQAQAMHAAAGSWGSPGPQGLWGSFGGGGPGGNSMWSPYGPGAGAVGGSGGPPWAAAMAVQGMGSGGQSWSPLDTIGIGASGIGAGASGSGRKPAGGPSGTGSGSTPSPVMPFPGGGGGPARGQSDQVAAACSSGIAPAYIPWGLGPGPSSSGGCGPGQDWSGYLSMDAGNVAPQNSAFSAFNPADPSMAAVAAAASIRPPWAGPYGLPGQGGNNTGAGGSPLPVGMPANAAGQGYDRQALMQQGGSPAAMWRLVQMQVAGFGPGSAGLHASGSSYNSGPSGAGSHLLIPKSGGLDGGF